MDYKLKNIYFFLQARTAIKAFKQDEHGNRIAIEFDKGTTTLGFKFKGGVIIAVDSRATGGEFISMLFFCQLFTKQIFNIMSFHHLFYSFKSVLLRKL